MHSIMRDVEIIGELSNTNEVYQKYKCLQSSICSTNGQNFVDINDINFQNNLKNISDLKNISKSNNVSESSITVYSINTLDSTKNNKVIIEDNIKNNCITNNKKEKKNKSVFNLL